MLDNEDNYLIIINKEKVIKIYHDDRIIEYKGINKTHELIFKN
jgi:hypothetical protein